jgi:hypothetical protein
MSASEAGESDAQFTYQEDAAAETRRRRASDDLLTVTDFMNDGLSARKSRSGEASVRAASDAINLGADDESVGPKNTAIKTLDAQFRTLAHIENTARGLQPFTNLPNANTSSEDALPMLDPDAAVSTLEHAAATAIATAVSAATPPQAAKQDNGDNGDNEDKDKDKNGEEALTTALRQANALRSQALLSQTHVDTAGRAFDAMHPAARHLFAAVADVRSMSGDVIEAAVGADVTARMLATRQLWEGARWATEDCYARIRALGTQEGTWRDALLEQMTPRWVDIEARARDELAQFTRAFAPYHHALRLALNEEEASTGNDADNSNNSNNGNNAHTEAGANARVSATNAIEALRRATVRARDAWLARDTALRTAVQQGAIAPSTSHSTMQATASRIASARKRHEQLTKAVNTARRRIIDAQSAQVQRLQRGTTPTTGFVLASDIAHTAALDAATATRIDDLVSARKGALAEIAEATASLAHARSRLRAQAAKTLLEGDEHTQGHRHWLNVANARVGRANALEQEAVLLRVQTAALEHALADEVTQNKHRVRTQAREAFSVCAAGAKARLDAALAYQQRLRSTALQPLDAAEVALLKEMRALTSFEDPAPATTPATPTTPQSFTALPFPALRMVDDTLRMALRERVAAAQVVRTHEYAASLQNVADALHGGLHAT